MAACHIQWIVSHIISMVRAPPRRRAARTGRRLPACRRGGNTRMRLSARRERSRARTGTGHCAVPDRPLLQGRPPGVSTPVYEKIWSQFKGTHDQRCTERCDVPSRGSGATSTPTEPRTQADAIEHATNGSAAPPRAAHRASSFGVAVCARDKIQNKSCCVCRLQSGARCGPPPVGRPPSALQQRAASMLRWHFTLQRGRIAGYSLR